MVTYTPFRGIERQDHGGDEELPAGASVQDSRVRATTYRKRRHIFQFFFFSLIYPLRPRIVTRPENENVTVITPTIFPHASPNKHPRPQPSHPIRRPGWLEKGRLEHQDAAGLPLR